MNGPVSWLAAEAAAGRIHTVRMSFSGRLGNWRGKRVPVQQFLASAARSEPSTMGFCDGMLLADVCCDVIPQTPFTNYDTGYPDVLMWYLGSRIRPARWCEGEAYVFGSARDMAGEPVPIHTPNVLARVLQRWQELGAAAEVRARLGGRLMSNPTTGVPVDRWADGSTWGLLGEAVDGLLESGVAVEALSCGAERGLFTLALGPGDPAELAEDLVVAKAALKELATRDGLTASFMTLPPGGRRASRLEISVRAGGIPEPDPDVLVRLLTDARPLLQPSVNAYKAGPPIHVQLTGGDGQTRLATAVAAAEADPFTAIAVVLAAVGEAATGESGTVAGCPPAAVGWIAADARRLASTPWLDAWLGKDFLVNNEPLLAREGDLLAGSVTDVEVARYWSLG